MKSRVKLGVKNPKRVDVFKYLDYREFLSDYRDACGFSYRGFAELTGMKSPNFLKLVIIGQRGLGDRSRLPFKKVLKLTVNEDRFFWNLVAFNQAKDPLERIISFTKVARSNIIMRTKADEVREIYSRLIIEFKDSVQGLDHEGVLEMCKDIKRGQDDT